MTRIGKDKIEVEEQSTQPNDPSSGEVAIYSRDDGNIYKKDSTGTEILLGGPFNFSDMKDSVMVATNNTNIDLTNAADPNPIDGVTLSDGERVLLKDQTSAVENGIYEAVQRDDPTTWIRTEDFNDDSDVTAGAFMFVEEGTENGDEGYVVTSDDPITVGTDAIELSRFTGVQLTAGQGLVTSGDTINLRMPIEDNGSQVVNAYNLNFTGSGGASVTVSDDNDDTATIDISSTGKTNEEIQDIIWNNFSVGSNLTFTYDDANDSASISLTGSSYTDEDAQDAFGAMLTGTQTLINVSYDDVNDEVDFVVQEGSIDHDALTNFVANEHIDHSTVTVTGGTGLTGGGDLTSSRTIDIDADAGDLNNINTGTLSAGQTLLYDATNTEFVNASITAGNALTSTSADGSFTLDVAADGIQTGELDLSIAPTWTSKHQFSAGIDTRGDIEDDTTVIWDSSNSWIPQAVLENDSLTLTAGDGLKNGGSVSLGGSTTLDIEPADFAGTFLSDDGSDNLTVDIAEGLENDGSGNVQTIETAQLGGAGMREIADGQSNNEIARLTSDTGERIRIRKLKFQQSGGGTNNNLSVRVQDITAGNTVGSVNLGGVGENLGTAGEGNTVALQISNSSGSTKFGDPAAELEIERV